MPKWAYEFFGPWLEAQQCPGISETHKHSRSLKGKAEDGSWNTRKGEKWVTGLSDGMAKIAAMIRTKLIKGDVAAARVMAVDGIGGAALPLATADHNKPYRSFGVPQLPKLAGVDALVHLHLSMGHMSVPKMKATIKLDPTWCNANISDDDWIEYLRKGCLVCDLARTKESRAPRKQPTDQTISPPGKRFVADSLSLRQPSAEFGFDTLTRFICLTSHKKFTFAHNGMTEMVMKQVYDNMSARNRPIHGEMHVLKMDEHPTHRAYGMQRFIAASGGEQEMSAPYRHEGVNVVEVSWGNDVPRMMALLIGARLPCMREGLQYGTESGAWFVY